MNRLSKVILLGFLGLSLKSCTTESELNPTSELKTVSPTSVNYNYSANEIETLSLINDYRKSKGLATLEKINFISVKSEEHANYMIVNNVVNHNDFVARSNAIIKALGAKTVSENIAYNYAQPVSAFNAWLLSAIHKENIEGDFSHFGISIRQDPATGKKYYVNIFAKI